MDVVESGYLPPLWVSRQIGECAWTGRTDNTRLGVRDAVSAPVELEEDGYHDFGGHE